MFYVIGSGPAGVSCAHALLRRGEQVTMIDAGIVLEEGIAKELEDVRRTPPADWQNPKTESGAVIARIKAMVKPRNGKIETKLVFGSDYPYRDAQRLGITQEGASCKPSLAKGGFSTAWGAAILPYPKEELDAWPVKAKQLEPYFRMVTGFMDVAGEREGLEDVFPIYAKNPQEHRKSRQALALLKDMKRNTEALERRGMTFGASRLALRTAAVDGKPGCAYCGLCMYGCPYNLIYNSALTMQELEKKPGFGYMDGVVVEKVSEDEKGVRIMARSLENGKLLEFSGNRVFLACGAVSSTKIVMASKGAYDTPVMMKDSQYFTLPLVRYANVSGVTKEGLHTLAQVFLEISDTSISKHLVHLQIYTYNELMLQVIKARFGALYPLMKLPVGQLIGRMMLIQGFLHSDQSPTITMTLEKGKDGDLLRLRSQPSSEARKAVNKVVKKLMGAHALLGAMPLVPMLDLEMPGKSFHYGSSLPMSANPQEWESDALGRPKGFKRVHVVDASVLPSLPAQTITFTVMANAYRIGSEYDKLG